MYGKKQALAKVALATGLTSLIESLRTRPVLLVLNYHRIGNARETPYDSGVFSATAEEFRWQIDYLGRHLEMVDLPRALEIASGSDVPKSASCLITFDDGYLDNYEVAFPILRAVGASASFFLSTAFTGTGKLPWWDQIAYIVKGSRRDRITLQYPAEGSFDLRPSHRFASIAAILRVFKQPEVTDTERFVSELEAACEFSRPSGEAERCFLNWEEAREMQAAGMHFGSHTHTHPILSKLSYAEQMEELTVSRGILEQDLRRPITTLAYPVGQRNSFAESTRQALKQAGYTAAFSFFSGVNVPGDADLYNVLRSGFDEQPRAVLRLRTAIQTVTGRNWF